MGGDFAPIETVAGAVEGSRRGVEVVLVGRADTIRPVLDTFDVDLPVVDAADVIGMSEDPARALRDKPQASISVCAKLVAEGGAEGFVSAGSTGAAMAAAAILVGRVPGVIRPAIASIFPTPETPTVVLDVGANPDVRPEQLLQFGIMGSLAAQILLGMENPRVGLLSNGEEKGKGRDLERAAYDLFESSDLNFIGNVEGRDVASNRTDVIVTDGFTGNVFLKTTEGASKLVTEYFLEEMSHLSPEVQEQMFPALAAVGRKLDPEVHGGAQLLGVKTVAIIAHGSSSRVAIANALVMASDSAEANLPGRLAEML